MSGLLIAAPTSGSGKTFVTLGLLRALRNKGCKLAPGKAGPDYIDPAFHSAAAGEVCLNFDPWAMRPEFLMSQAAAHMADGRLLIIEAMMGLFDGAASGDGTPADLAKTLDLNIVLVVDCAHMSQSVAAMVKGYFEFRKDLRFAGVVLNRVGSDRHEQMLCHALGSIGVRILGIVRRNEVVKLPARHLGLVQAGEHEALEAFIEKAAEMVEAENDLDSLLAFAGGRSLTVAANQPAPIAPLGSRIAVARDLAFSFSYQHILQGWYARGASISFFSPLANEGPADDADAVYLPGGYPELHAGKIACAEKFMSGMQAARDRGAVIYGECGGYMVLGEGLIDADGVRHPMLGFLPVETSFAKRERHLGYRVVKPVAGGIFNATMKAHEFHYSTVVHEEVQQGVTSRLFSAQNARGDDLGSVGLQRGKVAGSYMHLIDLAESAS